MKQKSFPKTFKISEFSKISGLSIKALRLYEERGLLIPKRNSENSYRIYSSAEYLRTLLLVDIKAQEKLLSVLSEKARKLVQEDLLKLQTHFEKFW